MMEDPPSIEAAIQRAQQLLAEADLEGPPSIMYGIPPQQCGFALNMLLEEVKHAHCPACGGNK